MYHKTWVKKKKKIVSVQHISLYNISDATASIIKHTSIQILICLQQLINDLLNLQTTYPIATNKTYQNFITDIILETILGSECSY